MNDRYQLILLPGLGTDSRLFELQRKEFPRLIVPPWIPPRKNESLPDYAARMAATIKPTRDVPLILGGVSFGGMLAYEMARHLKPDAVVLIASCRRRRGLRGWYRAGRWLLPLVPIRAWSVVKLLAAPSLRLSCRMSSDRQSTLVAMFREMDSRFMHWTVRAILRWRPTPLEGVPVHQIHGRRDRVLPASRTGADTWIPDGGHLINVTHAEQVNAFIERSAMMSK